MNKNDLHTIPESAGIYKITNPKGKVYVGQSKNLKLRFKSHLYETKSQSTLLGRSIKKYGIKDHLFEILELTENLSERERFYIEQYNSLKEGLNLIDRSYELTHGDHQKASISETLKKSWTEERKLKQSEKLKSLWISGNYRTRKPGAGYYLKGTMSVREVSTDKIIRVTKEEYHRNPNLVGTTAGRIVPNRQKRLKDTTTGIIYEGVVLCSKKLGIRVKKLYSLIHNGRFIYVDKV